MKVGTVIRLADDREGTVVYNHLDGVGIKWGRHELDEDAAKSLTRMEAGDEWAPDAMLREPYPSSKFECVGEDCEIVHAPSLQA